MSLINDALKRAREAQQQSPPQPSSELQFRPVEPAQQVRRGVGLMVPVGLTLIALCGLFLVWRRAQENRVAREPSVAPSVQARSASDSPPAMARSLEPSAALPSPAPATPPVPAMGSSSVTSAPSNSATATTVVVAPAQTNASPAVLQPTNQVADVAATAPKPSPLKLQSIVYSPTHPSALINGHPLFIGDKIREYRVSAIEQDAVTLIGGGQTNRLTLGE